MSGTFAFYAEPAEVVSDDRRKLIVGLGEVGGLDLAYIGVSNGGDTTSVLVSLSELRDAAKALRDIDPAEQQRSSGYYLYRVVITRYPDGALDYYETDDGDRHGYPDRDWTPEGWAPDSDWIAQHGSSRFFWPSTKFRYRSQSSARARAKLIESYGATAVVERSSLITWPTEGES